MQKKLSKGITMKTSNKKPPLPGDAANPGNKGLKINYSDVRRIPEDGEEMIAEKEKEAQKEANESTRRRHQMQSYNIEPIEFPEWKPFDNEDWSLADPRRMREFSDYRLENLGFPELKKLLLSLLKSKLGDLYNSDLKYPGLFYPMFNANSQEETEGYSQRGRVNKQIWDYADLNIQSETESESVSGNIWSGIFEKYTLGTMTVITFTLNADADSNIGTENIIIPFDIDMALFFTYSVGRSPSQSSYNTYYLHMMPPEINAVPDEWRDNPASGTYFDYNPMQRPKAYTTSVSADIVNNTLRINEEFLYQTSRTVCNHRRSIDGTIIMGADTPDWMEWQNE